MLAKERWCQCQIAVEELRACTARLVLAHVVPELRTARLSPPRSLLDFCSPRLAFSGGEGEVPHSCTRLKIVFPRSAMTKMKRDADADAGADAVQLIPRRHGIQNKHTASRAPTIVRRNPHKKETRGLFFVVTQGEGQRGNAPEGRLSRPVQSKCAQRETRALRRHTQRETGGGQSQVLVSALEFVFTAESNDDGEARRETDADDVTLTRRATN